MGFPPSEMSEEDEKKMRKKKRDREERMKMECKWEIRYTLYQCYVIVKFHRCGLVSEKKERR